MTQCLLATLEGHLLTLWPRNLSLSLLTLGSLNGGSRLYPDTLRVNLAGFLSCEGGDLSLAAGAGPPTLTSRPY